MVTNEGNANNSCGRPRAEKNSRKNGFKTWLRLRTGKENVSMDLSLKIRIMVVKICEKKGIL